MYYFQMHIALYLLGVYATYYSLLGGRSVLPVNHVSLFLLMTAYMIYI
jgi:hypothetical protein